MDEFVSAFVSIRDSLLRLSSVSLDVAAYIQAPQRLTEAGVVTDCVSRFATSELRPAHKGKPVGRFTPVSVWPPIGSYLGARIESPDTYAAVRRLLLLAVARGYLAIIDSEASTAHVEYHVVPERAARDVWPYWVTNIATGNVLKDFSPRSYSEEIGAACAEDPFAGLRKLGLLGWRRGRTRYIGSFYGQAGMLLRILQWDQFQPNAHDDLRKAASPWPFEAMPTNP